MAPFVFGIRGNLRIIDVTKTVEKLAEAIDFLVETVRGGGVVLWLGARVQSRGIIETTAKELNMPYVVGRWIGGLFTNFKIIKDRLKYFRELESKVVGSEMALYTKKEQLNFRRKLAKMEREMGGVKNLEVLPQVIFVSDVESEMDAILEARKVGIKTVALVDTGADPKAVDYPIPVNNDSLASIGLVVGAIKKELLALKK